jgi:peptidoglycan/xylan/chitin deacetylase (PgdA/CDA1 family)
MIVERLAPADRALHERLEAGLRGRPLSDPDDAWKRPLQRELETVAAPILGALVSELIGAEGDIAAQLYLSDDQLADLRKAEMDLGGHGFDHPWLDFVGRGRVVAELEASARLLSRFCDEPWPFAYPYGGVPGDVASLLPPAGFGAAFTTNPVDQDPPLHIGRLDADELSTGPAHALAAPP